MYYSKFKDKEVSLLGMGCMRLPLDSQGEVDVDASVAAIRKGIDEGINYMDTAYVYHNGFSERVLGMALRDGYREKVLIADKMSIWLAKTEEDLDRLFDKQLSRLGTDYIDIYLLHNQNRNFFEKCKKLNIFSWLDQKKKEGKIRYTGFSFHDEYDVFEEIIKSYDWDMCQIQFNYIDENYQAGIRGLKLAGEMNIPVVIMEPLKGGRLASKLPPQIEPMWKEMSEDRKPVDWAFRWVADHPQVMTILSGMSSMDQVTENLELFKTITPGCLSDGDRNVLSKIADTFRSLVEYGCTECRYCMPCPQRIDIPKTIRLYNDLALYDNAAGVHTEYNWMAPYTASKCVECKACESHCPQSLPVSSIMKKCVEKFGE